MTRSPFAVPLRPAQSAAPLARPSDALFRGLACLVKHRAEDGKRPVLDILRTSYGYDDMTRGFMLGIGYQVFGTDGDRQVQSYLGKAASIPADLTTSGWADSLVQTTIGDFIQGLVPKAVFSQLSKLGDSFTFGRNGAVLLPSRNTAATVSGAFVGVGLPIPVKQGQFLPITLTPKKMAVITTVTRELTLHSVPTIESVLKAAILDDTSVALDVVLLDTNAATAVRPAGLRSVTKITASVTTTIVGFIADLKAMISAFITGTRGNFRNPVWIMNPVDVLAAQLLPTTGGADYFFQTQLSQGMLLGIPIIQSTNVTADTMILTDGADFVVSTGDTPEFEIADQMALHMEDTAPAGITGPGAVFASPVRSMWQTDSIAIKMHLPINFSMRRLGVTQWTDTLAWSP
jgi:HK97 family phage major capsid protein